MTHPKHKHHEPRSRLLSFENLVHGKSAYLLGAILVLFVAYPIAPEGQVGDHVLTAVTVLVMLAAAFSVSGGGWKLRVLGGLVAINVVAKHVGNLTGLPPVFAEVIGALFFATVVSLALGRFFRARDVSADTIASALTTYLLIGLLWLNLYEICHILVGADGWSAPLVSELDPKPKNALFYFSFVTLTTLGYGDISPVHPGIRSLAIVEAIIGQFYVGVVIARLVGLELTRHRRKD